MLLTTWHHLLLHRYDPTVLFKGYSFVLTKQLFNSQALHNENIGRRVNTFLAWLSIYKILTLLSMIALKDFSKG